MRRLLLVVLCALVVPLLTWARPVGYAASAPDIEALAARGALGVTLRGDGQRSDRVMLTLVNRTGAPLRVLIPAGQPFVSARSDCQVMAAVRRSEVPVDAGVTICFPFEVMCADLSTHEPPPAEEAGYRPAPHPNPVWGDAARSVLEEAARLDRLGQFLNTPLPPRERAAVVARLAFWTRLADVLGQAEQILSRERFGAAVLEQMQIPPAAVTATDREEAETGVGRVWSGVDLTAKPPRPAPQGSSLDPYSSGQLLPFGRLLAQAPGAAVADAANGAPVVDTLLPAASSIRHSIFVRGRGFGEEAARVRVFFGRAECLPTTVTDTALSVKVPQGAPAECRLYVVRDGLWSNGVCFHVGRSVSMDVGANPLDVGATTQARFTALHTWAPVEIRYTLRNPDVVQIVEGNEGTLVTCGGPQNLATLNVRGIAGPRRYEIDYEFHVREAVVDTVRIPRPSTDAWTLPWNAVNWSTKGLIGNCGPGT